MRLNLAHLISALCLGAVLLAPVTTQAQEPPGGAVDPAEVARSKYEQIWQLAQDSTSDSRSGLEAMVRELDSIRTIADRCADQAEADLIRVKRQEATLNRPEFKGQPAPTDPAEGALPQPSADAPPPAPGQASPPLQAMLAQVADQRARLEARIATCRLLELNSYDLSTELVKREQQLLTGALLERGPNLVEVMRLNLQSLHEWPRAGQSLVRLVTGIEELGWFNAGVLMLLVIATGLTGMHMQRQPLRILPATGQVPFATGLLIALRAVVHRRAPLLLVLLAINGFLAFHQIHGDLPPLFAKLAQGALLLLAAAMLAEMLLAPPAPAFPLVNVGENQNRRLARQLQMLALLFLIGLLLRELNALQVIDLVKRRLLSDIYVLFLLLNVVSLVRMIGRDTHGMERFFKRVLPVAGVMAILLASWLGFRDLARFLFWSSVSTVLALLLMLFLSRLVSDLQDGFDLGRYGWQRTVRRIIGLEASEPVPGLGWLTLLIQLTLWGVWLALILRVWGLPDQAFQLFGRLFSEGFAIGSVTIVPSRLVWAILTLLLVLMGTSWIKAQLEKRWLVRTRMERGAREAIATSFGYAAVAAAVLLALSMAGIDFSNLALIAGALSVGIGFGLQNVVNNFVSGLIMLFERPVKTGDWIVVGATEGYVRKISIRTTTIQTFDRSEVIVPNADLISGQLTNWTHSNVQGRFKLPIGVAYGSDTEKVRDLLLGVAREHPEVVKNAYQWPDPWVLFTGFGDSSLNFELRGIVQNVEKRLTVISDLNFAIDRAFRDNGIEIPFPQRVVHMAQPTATPAEPSDSGFEPAPEPGDPGEPGTTEPRT